MKYFSKFIQKLTRLSTHDYQSFHCFKALAPTFFRYFADKVKMPKIIRAITHEIFFRIYSKLNQVIYSTLPIF